MFIGYPKGVKAYVLFDYTTRATVISWNVVFDENVVVNRVINETELQKSTTEECFQPIWQPKQSVIIPNSRVEFTVQGGSIEPTVEASNAESS